VDASPVAKPAQSGTNHRNHVWFSWQFLLQNGVRVSRLRKDVLAKDLFRVTHGKNVARNVNALLNDCAILPR